LPTQTPASPKRNKTAIAIASAVAALIIIVFVVSLSGNGNGGGGGGLSGTWEYNDWQDGNSGTAELTFSGNRYTAVIYFSDESDRIRFVNTSIFIANEIFELFNTYEHIPRSFGWGRYFMGEIRGTFSASDEKIEFILPNGSIEVFDISRTENTITIGNMRFDRKR
jgi:hypothetical protein